MKNNGIPHPLFCGFAWVALMFVIAVIFVSVENLIAGLSLAQPFRGDQWLSLVILLTGSFIIGFSLAWIRRHRQSKPSDTKAA